MSIASVLDGAMEMDRVFVEEIGRCQVCAAAKPPCLWLPFIVHRLEVAVVEVNGGRHGIVGVENHADAGREEFEILDVWINGFVVDTHLLDGLAGKGAVDDGSIDSGFLEDVAVLQHARDAAPAIGSRPDVFAKPGGRLEALEGRHNMRLLRFDEGLHAKAHGGGGRNSRLADGQGVALGDRRRLGELRWLAGNHIVDQDANEDDADDYTRLGSHDAGAISGFVNGATGLPRRWWGLSGWIRLRGSNWAVCKTAGRGRAAS